MEIRSDRSVIVGPSPIGRHDGMLAGADCGKRKATSERRDGDGADISTHPASIATRHREGEVVRLRRAATLIVYMTFHGEENGHDCLGPLRGSSCPTLTRGEIFLVTANETVHFSPWTE